MRRDCIICRVGTITPQIGRFINGDALASSGQGLLGNNMFSYCGNNPISRTDASGLLYEEADEYRVVGGGIQLEVDVGNVTVGIEIIIYWDVDECSDNGVIIAVYTYFGGSVNFSDDFLGSILATIRNNINLTKGGTVDTILDLVDIIEAEYSVSASGLLILGNEQFDSALSYEGPFLSAYGSLQHIKGSVAVSNSCIAIGLGVTSSAKPSLGFSVTNYTLRGIIPIEYPANVICTTKM